LYPLNKTGAISSENCAVVERDKASLASVLILTIGRSFYKRCVVLSGVDAGDRVIDYSDSDWETAMQNSKLFERLDPLLAVEPNVLEEVCRLR